jgi:hypothetical protein
VSFNEKKGGGMNRSAIICAFGLLVCCSLFLWGMGSIQVMTEEKINIEDSTSIFKYDDSKLNLPVKICAASTMP